MPSEPDLFEVLRRFARTMANPYEVGDVLDGLCRSACVVLHSSSAGVALFDERERIRYATASDADSRTLEWAQERSQSGPCVSAIRIGAPVVIHDMRSCVDWPDYRAAATRIGVVSALSVPMVLDGRRVGALDVYSTRPRAWSATEVRGAETLADVAAAYILNADALHRAQRTAEQLQIALRSRVVIEQAKGRLAAELGVSVEQAFETLRSFARRHHRPLHDLARDVTEQGARTLAES